MKCFVVAAAVAVGLLGTIAASWGAEVTAEQVRNAIDRGVHYLKNEQRGDGSWGDSIDPSGITSLCTLALLNAGIEPSDEPIQKALAYLRNIEPTQTFPYATYTVSLQTMVFARAEPERDLPLIRRNVEWLEGAQIHSGWYQGAWSYFGRKAGSGGDETGDNSNSQFALLALYEAQRVGVLAGDQTWLLAKQYWAKCQNKDDGSWGYKREIPNGTGSMTCAGITSLAIACDRAEMSDVQVVDDRIECCAPRKADNDDAFDRIDRGVEWLGHNFSVRHNPGSFANWLYYLYGLERTGRLTARRFLPLSSKPGQPARADWYREGAEYLIQTQDAMSGFWTGKASWEAKPVIGTCFALLFLSKGRWPVLLGKLQFGPGDDWNRHHSNAANLTRYVESRWKRDLTWQTIDLGLASLDDLLQTPVLYLGGSRSPLPDDPARQKELAQKIRDYLDRGGFLFAEPNCGGADFDAGFRELMRLAFPEPEYKLQLLDSDHPIWHAEEKIAPEQVRPLWGIESGCRTSVVYASPDGAKPSLSCLWELARPGRGQKFSPVVQNQIDAALSLGINVLAYATNRELKTKDEFLQRATARGPSDRVERGRLYVATLRHPGGCNAAARSVVNLMDTAAAQLKIRVHVREQLLDIADDSLADYHLVFMHGRTSFHLTDTERQTLRKYVERGGMVMADSICASRAFTESFRREMAAIFPNQKLEPIPADDPLWSTKYGGADLRIVSRRDPAAAAAGGGPLDAAIHKVPPDLEGVKLGDHWGVVFSQYDLSLRPGKPRIAGLPRLHPRRRRPNRTQRGALFVATITC